MNSIHIIEINALSLCSTNTPLKFIIWDIICIHASFVFTVWYLPSHFLLFFFSFPSTNSSGHGIEPCIGVTWDYQHLCIYLVFSVTKLLEEFSALSWCASTSEQILSPRNHGRAFEINPIKQDLYILLSQSLYPPWNYTPSVLVYLHACIDAKNTS